MKRSPRPQPANLSTSVHQQLSMYAIAASAAGIGVLGLTQSADAKIVYTPADVQLRPFTPFPLDLNHDGVVDFYLDNYYFPPATHGLSACQFIESRSSPFCLWRDGTNAVRVTKPHGLAAALRSGAIIQSADPFVNGIGLGLVEFEISTQIVWFGPWMNGGKGVKNRYLGLKFKIEGRFHFGWARITVTTDTRYHSFTAVLTGYAYETIPGKEIIAGKTHGPDGTVKHATLGELAAGRK